MNHYVFSSYKQRYQQPTNKLNYNRCQYNNRSLSENQQIAYNDNIYRESVYTEDNDESYYDNENNYNSQKSSQEVYSEVLSDDYELQSQDYDSHLQQNTYQSVYINRSSVLHDSEEYTEDHKEMNAQFITENAVELCNRST